MWYIDSRLLDGGEFKNKISFPFRLPSHPNKGVAGGAWGGEGVADTYTQQKTMKYINSGVPNNRDFKNEVSFPFRIHSRPEQGRNQGSFRGGLRPIHNIR